MFKLHEIGDYKTAKNIGYCVATTILKNGMGVVADEAKRSLLLPTADATDISVVMNRIDKPETHSPNEFSIEIGEPARVFQLSSISGKLVDMDSDQIEPEYSAIAVGDLLVYGTNGKLSKGTGSEKIGFKVIEKTSFGGNGILAKVIA